MGGITGNLTFDDLWSLLRGKTPVLVYESGAGSEYTFEVTRPPECVVNMKTDTRIIKYTDVPVPTITQAIVASKTMVVIDENLVKHISDEDEYILVRMKKFTLKIYRAKDCFEFEERET